MATAQTIIDRAGRMLSLVQSGQSMTSAESADALIALNAMLQTWQINKTTVYAIQDKTYTLAGASAITLGAAGNITTRPDKIEAVFIRKGSDDYPVDPMTFDEWVAISDKTVTNAIPNRYYYEASYPQGVLNLNEVPSEANVLHVLMWTPFTAFSAVSDSVSLPPGYERAMASNLAIEIAPEFEREPSMTVRQIAANSLRAIRSINTRPIMLDSEIAALVNGSTENIITGA